ncbi:MAG: RNA polymerase sigma factor, partial [Phycisphaerae bacterium]|nr:RNA polymerase sigma factor [Phycisphaerae bacterium]
VIGAQGGDRLAADRLIREHDHWVRSVVFGVTGRADLVDDIVQQVWTQVWQSIGSLQEPRLLRRWLYRIARNAAIDAGMANRRRRTREVGIEDEPTQPDRSAATPFGAALGSELRETLLRAVQALPLIYREPFALKHLEDWSYAEIGELLGMPVETVETRLVRARRLLREMLAGKV